MRVVMLQIRGKLTREKTLEKITRETDMLSRLQGKRSTSGGVLVVCNDWSSAQCTYTARSLPSSCSSMTKHTRTHSACRVSRRCAAA